MGPKARKGGSANPTASPGGRSRGRSRSHSRSPRQGSPSPTLIPNTSPTGYHMSSEPSSLLNTRVQPPTSEEPPSWLPILLKAITESWAPGTVSVPQPQPAQQPQPLDPGPRTSRGIPLTQLGLMSEPTPPLVSFPTTQTPRPCTPASQVVPEDRRFRDLGPERPPNSIELPQEQECLELVYLLRNNVSSSKLAKRDGHEVSLLLGIAADWDALPGPVRSLVYNRARILTIAATHGWDTAARLLAPNEILRLPPSAAQPTTIIREVIRERAPSTTNAPRANSQPSRFRGRRRGGSSLAPPRRRAAKTPPVPAAELYPENICDNISFLHSGVSVSSDF
ncbi:putative uncharacterized protein DDB_G0290521 [Ischnura elegans]|uniref:putative uncharacterized protein DDB_G0290521 n=1 Tax=Ischnura elegans TaxID=197161 RepID=UPI001ED89713|nr:putative uncharacterized protein DDB_G0290521 [Ischnura elegans]